ncbi:MAG TPA: PAC2 family protein [Acidimicrobiales bacterium]|nr:PAC2 family protein [Acidimicrobiales bacterium]|tara:strand:+ start:4865 stop:5740 length:876 start_codon:yes stop_codon:yes gene_type:complete
MTELRWNPDFQSSTDLDRPVLAVAFKGLFDASGAATSALEWLSNYFPVIKLGEIDPETFFDFTQERPTVSFGEDGGRELQWPSNEINALKTPEGQRDLVVIAGVEPHLRWRTFSAVLTEVAHQVQAETVTTLGSMIGMIPHTRPLTIIGSSTNHDLAKRLGLNRPSYQGPTGLVGALHDTLDKANMPVLSLRVSVPHYIPDAPNPKATRALLRRFEMVTGIDTGYMGLDSDASDWEKRVDEAVAGDPEITAYVSRLEMQSDQSEEKMPSGDDLAAEFEAFLRDHNRSSDDQ